jgi:NTE family protein
MGDPKRTVSRSQWLRRLASRKREKVAFVLSGGGPYGALQVGALRALIERGIQPDLVIGTSAGSMNATFVAFDPSIHGVDRLESIWRALEDEDLFPGVRFKTSWARFLMRGNKVFDNVGMRRVIETRLGTARFEDARVPLAVVATDLETGAEVLFSSGDLTDPLLASCAMPGIYPPVVIGARTYIDGGVANQVPIAPAIGLGASKIYVIDASSGHQKPRPLLRPIDYLLHAFQLSRAQRVGLEMPSYRQKADVVMLPVPAVDFTIPFTSLAHTDTLIRLGYDHAAAFLDSVPSAAVAPMPPPPLDQPEAGPASNHSV